VAVLQKLCHTRADHHRNKHACLLTCGLWFCRLPQQDEGQVFLTDSAVNDDTHLIAYGAAVQNVQQDEPLEYQAWSGVARSFNCVPDFLLPSEYEILSL